MRKRLGACAEAGAELFVAGTAIFAEVDYASAIERIHSAAVAKKVSVQASRN